MQYRGARPRISRGATNAGAWRPELGPHSPRRSGRPDRSTREKPRDRGRAGPDPQADRAPADGPATPPVLINGETGTGKGLIARILHRASARARGPFVDVNCAAIPDTLLEAELFGYERGAFTDARQPKAGLFQTAHRGTLFLDEIGLLAETLQAKLLKVIEERSVRRLGATRSEPFDVWLLCATNEDLAVAIRQRRFREDLYHRLAVFTLRLPPLRERGEDVGLLADEFLARACATTGCPSRPSRRRRARASWPTRGPAISASSRT